MADSSDSVALAKYVSILRSLWHISGYIQWRRVPQEWLRQNLPNATIRHVNELMHQHVAAGGKVKQVPERREEWLEYRFHYDLILTISGRRIYVETVLVAEDDDDPTIRVVSVHDA